MKLPRRRWLVLAGLLAFAGSAAVVLSQWPDRANPLDEWPDRPEDQRQELAERIVKDRVLMGMSEGEARRRLGEPSSENPGDLLRYFVGTPSGMARGVQLHYLIVHLHNGRVVGTNIIIYLY